MLPENDELLLEKQICSSSSDGILGIVDYYIINAK